MVNLSILSGALLVKAAMSALRLKPIVGVDISFAVSTESKAKGHSILVFKSFSFSQFHM